VANETQPTLPCIRPQLEDLISLRLDAAKLTLKKTRRASSLLAGQHRSRFKGRGMDFNEVRTYQPGDDIRHIDWRVTARTQVPHTKLYTEERERPVYFIVDLGPSMQFGTRKQFKSVLAARAASLLAWSSVAHGDRVGGYIISGKQKLEVKAGGGSKGATALIGAMSGNHRGSPHSEQDLSRYLSRVRPGSLIFYLSDFTTLQNRTCPWIGLAQHSDFVLLQIVDTLEAEPPPPGRYPITDGKETIVFKQTRALQAQMKQEFSVRCALISDWSSKYAFTYLRLNTEDDLVYSLRSGLTTQTRLFS